MFQSKAEKDLKKTILDVSESLNIQSNDVFIKLRFDIEDSYRNRINNNKSNLIELTKTFDLLKNEENKLKDELQQKNSGIERTKEEIKIINQTISEKAELLIEKKQELNMSRELLNKLEIQIADVTQETKSNNYKGMMAAHSLNGNSNSFSKVIKVVLFISSFIALILALLLKKYR